jgi:hypothetical protein
MATADNLKIAQQLLATMQQITAQVEKQTEAYHAQAQLVEALCKAQECFGKIDADKVREVTDSLREAQEKTKQFGASLDEVSEESVSKLEGALRKVSDVVSKLSIPAEFLNGFKAGLNLSTNLFTNILSVGGSAFGLLKDIGGIFLSLPGRLMDFFEGAAGGGTDPYRQALEDLRKEFGNLEVGTSAAVKNMTESTKSLGESGLSLSKVFGHGREGLAKLLQENMEMFKAMGPLADRLAASIKGAEGEFTLLRKATGLGADGLKALQLSAEESGVSTATAVRSMTKQIALAERSFGISAKIYGKDLDYMAKESATFGRLSTVEMLKVSTYARKLGVSMETLKKIVDKSLNFEDAAQQAAKLSEAFGLALDPIKQMNETDPTKKLDNIRQALFRSGQTYEGMTVQARKYFAEQAGGLSDEEARIAFSQKNRALSGAQVDAQMKKAQKQQITQVEATQQLAKSIERLVQSGSAMKGSFFDIFAKGFETGIRRSKEFREVTRNLQRSLREVFFAGRDVGRMFVKEFPGIKEMLKGLADMFHPRRFRELMRNVVEEFRKFFKLLQTDPKAGVQQFMRNMKKVFFDFFTKGTPAGSRFLEGLKTFYKTVGAIFVEGLRFALESLKNILGIVIGFIRDPSNLKQAAVGAGEGIKGVFVQAFTYVVKELGPVLEVVGGQVVELMKLVFENYIKPHLLKLVTMIFGPALFMGIARAAGAAILKTGFEKIVGGFAARMPGAGGGAGGGINPADAAKQSGQFVPSMKSFGTNMAQLVIAMAVIAVAIRALMPIILSIAKEIENSGLSRESIAFTAVLIGIFGALFVGLGNMVKAIAGSEIDATKVGKAIPAMIAAGVILTALVPLAYLAVNVLGKLPVEDIAKTVFLMTSFTILFGAIGLLVGFMALEGTTLSAAIGPALLGIGVASLAMVAVGGVALLAVQVLGAIDMNKMLAAAATIGVFTVLFGAIGLLTAGLALLGAEMLLAAGPAVVGFAAVELVMIALGASAIVLYESFEGLDKDKAATSVGIMESMVGLFVGIAAGVGLLALAASSISWGGMAKLGLMLVAVGKAVTSLISMAKDMLQGLGTINIDEGKAKAGAAIMSAVANLMKDVVGAMASLALVGRGSLVGMIVGFDGSDSFGTIKNMLVGQNGLLNTIKSIVSELITSVSNIQGDPAALQAKAEVFTTITKGIAAILPPLGQLIETISSSGSNSLLGLIAGRDASKLIDNLSLIKTFINQFLDGIFKGPDGIVPKIIASFSSLSPAQMESLKVGAGLLSSFVPAIAEITKALPDTIRAVTGLVDELNTETEINRVLGSVQTMITGIIASMSGALTSVITSVSGILNNSAISPEKLKAAESFGGILKGVAELTKAFVLSPEQLRTFRQSKSAFGATESLDMSAVGVYMTKVTQQVQQLINGDPAHPENKGIKGIIDVIAGMSVDESKVKGITAVGSIVQVIGEMIPPIMAAIKSASDSVQAAALTPEQIAARSTLINSVIWSISGAISGMFTTVIPALITSLNSLRVDTKGLTRKVNALKEVFELLRLVTDISSSMRVTTTGAGGATTTSVRSVLDTISPVMNLLIGLFSITGVGNVAGHGQTTKAALDSLAAFVLPTNLTGKIKTLKTVFEALRALVDASSAINSSVTGQTAIRANVLDVPLQNVDKLVGGLTSPMLSNGHANPLMNPSAFAGLSVVQSNLRGKGAKVTQIAEALTEILRGASTIASIGPAATDLDAGIAHLRNRLERFFGAPNASLDALLPLLNSHFGDSAEAERNGTKMINISSNIRDRIMTPVRDMIASYNSFAEELHNLGSGTAPLQVTLDNLGTRLTGHQRMSVRNAAVNATINVNVVMDVDDVVQALHYHTTQNNTTTSRAISTSAYNPAAVWPQS